MMEKYIVVTKIVTFFMVRAKTDTEQLIKVCWIVEKYRARYQLDLT